MADPIRIPLVAVRYVGQHKVILGGGQQHYDRSGSLRDAAHVHTGDEILMPANHVLGETLYIDPARITDETYVPEWLGVGRVVKPEHRYKDNGSERSNDELRVMGYEFQEGRPDFEPLNVPAVITPLRPTLPVEPVESAEPAGGFVLGVHPQALAHALPGVAAPEVAPEAEPASATESTPLPASTGTGNGRKRAAPPERQPSDSIEPPSGDASEC